MALGKRKSEMQGAWVATTELPRSPKHPFYKQLNRPLASATTSGSRPPMQKAASLYYDSSKGSLLVDRIV